MRLGVAVGHVVAGGDCASSWVGDGKKKPRGGEGEPSFLRACLSRSIVFLAREGGGIIFHKVGNGGWRRCQLVLVNLPLPCLISTSLSPWSYP